jgi:hypothetical protein
MFAVCAWTQIAVRADDVKLVGTSLLPVCWPHQPCYKMMTTCSKLVNNWEQAVREHIMSTSCEIFTRVQA